MGLGTCLKPFLGTRRRRLGPASVPACFRPLSASQLGGPLPLLSLSPAWDLPGTALLPGLQCMPLLASGHFQPADLVASCPAAPALPLQGPLLALAAPLNPGDFWVFALLLHSCLGRSCTHTLFAASLHIHTLCQVTAVSSPSDLGRSWYLCGPTEWG